MKILVVDDEAIQVESIRRGLFLFGHEVLTAADADQAMSILEDSSTNGVELLITDMTMPGKSGLDLIDRAQAHTPDLPVMVITGLNSSHDLEILEERGVPVLQKPFAPDELNKAISGLTSHTDAE